MQKCVYCRLVSLQNSPSTPKRCHSFFVHSGSTPCSLSLGRFTGASQYGQFLVLWKTLSKCLKTIEHYYNFKVDENDGPLSTAGIKTLLVDTAKHTEEMIGVISTLRAMKSAVKRQKKK